MNIAVTGATGHLGRIVIKKLRGKGSVIALARNPAKAGDLGVEVRPFDYDQRSGMEAALGGVETLVLISASEVGKRAAQHRNVIQAAQAAGIKRIIYTSLLRADTSAISLAGEHKATEDMLLASGIPTTILRNGWYTENYTASLGGSLAAGAIVGSAGDGKLSLATREDYAEAVVAAVFDPSMDGNIYELAGDEAVTLADYAAEVSRQTGRQIPYRNLSESEYAGMLVSFGLPDELARAIASWDGAAAQGALFDDGHRLSQIIGRPTTPLSDAVKAALP